MKRSILKAMKALDFIYTHPDPSEKEWSRCGEIIEEIGREAAKQGLHDILALASKHIGPNGPIEAKQILAECLSLLPNEGELTAPQVAKRLKVSPDTVRHWIKAGKLPARNIAKPGGRPSYRISEAQLADFDKLAKVVKMPMPKRRHTADIPFRRYR